MAKQLSYADHMRKAMRDSNISLRDLQKALGYSYEHLRKIRTGRPLLSHEVSDAISDHLSLDKKMMWELASVEKMKNKFGAVPAELVPPSDERMRVYWTQLTRDEREELISIAEAYVKKHRALEMNRDANEEELVAIIANASSQLARKKRGGDLETRRRHA